MAVSNLRPIKAGRGKSVASIVKDRVDYYENPEKTDNGRLVSAYQCSPETASEEFMAVKHLYSAKTGRTRKDRLNAVMWRIMQSFKPDEISPEEANKIGYQFAREFTKGEYQFVVCTHADKKHIHNHIFWNSTALDCKHKWNDFYHSAYVARSINDRLCREHGLAVIVPKNKGKAYKEWAAEKNGVSWKKKLRQTIDTVLPTCPDFKPFFPVCGSPDTR